MLLFITALLSFCSQKTQDTVELTVNPKLLKQEPVTFGNFSFQVPSDWDQIDNESSDLLVFFSEADSSTLLAGLEYPNVAEFGEPQSSDFSYNQISFHQDVFQTEVMVFFAVKLQKSVDSMNLFYAIPRQHIDQRAKYVESSLGSINYITD